MKNNYLKKGAGLLLASAFLLSACGGNAQKKQENETQPAPVTAAASGVQTLQAGNVTITWIQDNAEDKLMPRSLFSDAPDSIINQLSLQAGIPSSVSTFVIKTDSLRILFDTGLGAPDSRLAEGLKSIGMTPNDIDCLYLTHLHGDHIGGMLKGDSIVFPNAEVYVSKTEYDAWMNMPGQQKAQAMRTMEKYKNHLHLFEFGDTLPGNVIAIDATGHTPGHTAFQVGKVLVAGDLMHGAALQKPHPEYCTNYDMDKKKAAETRVRILNYVQENKLVMAGMHLPAPAFLQPE